MNRRDFIALLGGAAAGWPLAARAQQAAMPVIGMLNMAPIETSDPQLAGFRKGAAEAGFVDGQNVKIEFRSAQNQIARLQPLVAELIRMRVNVIAAMGSSAPALAAKAATSTIPIVFQTGGDPV